MLSDEDFYNIDGTSVSETDSKLDSQISIQKQQHFYWPLPEDYLRQCSIISLVAARPFYLPRLRQLVSLAILAKWRSRCCYAAPNTRTHTGERRGEEKKKYLHDVPFKVASVQSVFIGILRYQNIATNVSDPLDIWR